MKKKILVIGGLPPPTGGMETVMENMIKLKSESYEMIPFNVAKNRLIKSNIIFNVANFLYRCIKLSLILLIKKPDIVHIHVAGNNKDFLQKKTYLRICKLLQKKTLLHMHGGGFPDFYEKSNDKDSIKKNLNTADGLIVLGEKWKKFYGKIHANKNIFILSNSVDLELIENYYRYRKNSKTVRLLFVGRIEKEKGIYEIIEVVRLLKDKNIHLNIMGPFMNNEKEIRYLCDKYGIADKITFLGVILGERRFKYFANSDLFVLPSYWECLPVSVLEAMAFGLPIVATGVGAIPDIVSDKNGILIRPKDITALEKAILKVIDSSKTDYYKKNNINVIKSNYTKQIFMKNLIQIYESFK